QYTLDPKILDFLETFRYMVNHCIRIGLQNKVRSLRRLSLLSYDELAQYNIPSYYKLCAISKAAGLLSNREQSIKRGVDTRKPYLRRLVLVSCYGYKFENGIFKIPLGDRKYFEIPLNCHSKQVLSDNSLKINSFTLTQDSISLSYSKDISEIECKNTAGIDRNLRNLTVGNCDMVTQFDISKSVRIAESTKSIVSSFKRNDFRIRKQIASKYGTRRKNRTNQILHHVSKDIVQQATKNKHALVFEDIRQIRKLYQKGNWQRRKHRGAMNGWSFSEIKRQIEYKSRWSGIPVIQLSKKETRGTSTLCPRCGKRLQEQRASRDLWCEYCQRWQDRDVVAVMNQSLRGLSRFDSSKGDAGEAMKGNVDNSQPLILKVDASKLQSWCDHHPQIQRA
ncbi:MAG: IS200/IS605 family accessory protein TnpB-related protein, partial [Nitrosopumilaceae archaeon]